MQNTTQTIKTIASSAKHYIFLKTRFFRTPAGTEALE